jgi:hypothetical protein
MYNMEVWKNLAYNFVAALSIQNSLIFTGSAFVQFSMHYVSC